MKDEVVRLSQLKETLNAANVNYIVHELTIRSAQEGAQQGLGLLANMAPTFIIRSERGYLAAIIPGDTRLSYKNVKQKIRLKNLSPASPEQVQQVTGSEIGYVSLINSGIVTIIEPVTCCTCSGDARDRFF